MSAVQQALGPWNYSFQTSTAAPPSTGSAKLNAAPPGATTTTKLWLSNTAAGGGDVSAQLLAIPSGATLVITASVDTTRKVTVEVTGGPVAKSGYVEIPVASAVAAGTIGAEAVTVSTSVGPPFEIWVIRDGNLDHQVGFAQDAANAAMLAGAWMVASQNIYPTVGAGVCVISTANGQVMSQLVWVNPKPPGSVTPP